MLSNQQQLVKRIFDLLVSGPLIVLLLLPMFVLWLLSTLSTGSNGLFSQLRIGKYGKPFHLLKFRSLKGSDHLDIREIRKSETPFGSWLRKYKLDELPQLFNVLTGDMSLVGPRPDVPGYADKLEGDDRMILNIRPGITGPATLKYRNEDDLLLKQKDPNTYNDSVIWPDKVKMNKEYIENWSLTGDIRYLWKSVFG